MITPDQWVEYGPWIVAALAIVVIGILWKELKDERQKRDELAGEYYCKLVQMAGDSIAAVNSSADATRSFRDSLDLYKAIEGLKNNDKR